MDVVTVGIATLLDLSTVTNQLVDSNQSIGPPYEGTNKDLLKSLTRTLLPKSKKSSKLSRKLQFS